VLGKFDFFLSWYTQHFNIEVKEAWRWAQHDKYKVVSEVLELLGLDGFGENFNTIIAVFVTWFLRN
jgi:hypothetical protein